MSMCCHALCSFGSPNSNLAGRDLALFSVFFDFLFLKFFHPLFQLLNSFFLFRKNG